MYRKIQFVNGVKFVWDISAIVKQRADGRQNSSESGDSCYLCFIILSKISPFFYDNFISCLNGELNELGDSEADVSFQDISSVLIIVKNQSPTNFFKDIRTCHISGLTMFPIFCRT